MSLLNKVSLLLTPNAVKEGKAYSIIPSNGNGDMTATRATTATLTNQLGYIEDSPYNLLKYSEMFSDASWSKINGASIIPNTVISPNGTLTADTVNFNGTPFGQIYQSITRNIGDIVTFSIWVKSSTSTSISLIIGTGVTVSFGVTNSWQRITYTKTLTTVLATPIIISNTVSSLDIWGAQIVQGSVAKDYFYTTDRLNVPRLNYDAVGGCPSILLEPQRTNLLTYSNGFDNVAWNKANVIITTSIITSPSNSLDAFTLDEGISNNIHNINNSIIVSSGINYTLSVYVKKTTMSFFRLILNDNITTTSWVCAQFNLDTLTYTSGVGTTGGTFTSASITSVGNGWYRCVLVGNIPTNGTALSLISPSNGTSISSADSRGRVSYLGTSKTISIWGAQSETGAYQTSYIPTVASTVTRNADVIVRNNIYTNGLITSAGGTWFIELNNNVPTIRGGSNPRISISDSLAPFLGNFFYIKNTVNELTMLAIIIGVNSGITIPYVTNTNNVKIAIKWNGVTANIFVNGVKVVSNYAFTTTLMEFLNADTATNIYIKSTMLFPTPLTDAEAIQLTTL